MEREKSSRREKGSRDGDVDDHRRHRHRSKHHRDEGNRHRSGDRQRQDRDRPIEREGSRDRGHDQSDDRRRQSEREGSRERAYDRERREKSFELEVNREDSVERRNSHKRKDRGENVDKRNVDEKRDRGSEDKKEKRRVSHVELMDKEERRERRRFDDKVKEDVEIDEERKGKGFEMRTVKEEPKPEPYEDGQDGGSIDTVSFFVSILSFRVAYHIYIVVLFLPMFVYVLLSSYCHAPLLLGYDVAYFCTVVG